MLKNKFYDEKEEEEKKQTRNENKNDWLNLSENKNEQF